MNPQSISCFSFLCSLFTIKFLFQIQAQPGGLSNLYQACGNTFSCGNKITGIMHPFRGSKDPPYCGHPIFVLTCDDHTNVTNISIMNNTYRVLEIDQNDKMMTIARADVMEGTCPTELVNMTLDHTIFDYGSSCRNFTFFYGCPASEPVNFISIPCGGNLGAYVASGTYGPGICNTSVIVTGSGNEGEGVSSGVVREALQKGFEIKWKIDSKSCSDCVASKGRCGTNLGTNQTVCYCPNPPYISDTCALPMNSTFLFCFLT
ncbi:hypothetical protein ACS0TY_008591 [Phlomoides rotata]